MDRSLSTSGLSESIVSGSPGGSRWKLKKKLKPVNVIQAIKAKKLKAKKKKIGLSNDIRKPVRNWPAGKKRTPQIDDVATKPTSATQVSNHSSSESESSSGSTSDEEFNSISNQIRRRLSALAYTVQLRQDTFREDYEYEECQGIINIIEKRREEKLMKEEEEDMEDKIPGSQKRFLFILFPLAVIAIAHIIAAIFCFCTLKPVENPHTCITPNCHRISDSFRHAMDRSVNPCEDFYLHVCGQYIDNHPVEPLDAFKPSFVEGIPFQYDGNRKLGMILNPVKDYPVNQVLPFYKSCIFQKRRDRHGFAPFVDLLKTLGILNPVRNSTRNRSIARLIARIYKITGRPVLIDVYETIDNYVAIGIPKPTPEFKRATPEVYASTMRKVLKSMQKELLIQDDDELDAIVYNVMRFEAEFYKLQTSSYSSGSAESNIFGFPNRMHQYIKVPSKLPPKPQQFTLSISWDDFIDELFVKDFESTEKPAMFFNYMYSLLSQNDRTNILFLEELLKRTPFRIICRYFQWTLIKEFSFDLTSELQDLMKHVVPSKGLTDTECCFRSLFANLNVLAAARFVMDMDNFNTLDKKMTTVLNVIMTGLVNMTMRLPEEFHEWMLDNFSSLKVTDSLGREISENLTLFYFGLNMSEEYYFKNVIQARIIKTKNGMNRIRKMAWYQDWPLGSFSLNEIGMTSIQDEVMHQKFLHVPFGGLQEPFVGNDLPVLDFGGFGYWVVSFYIMYNTIADIKEYFASERLVYDSKSAVRIEKQMEMVLLPRLECVQEAWSKLELPTLPGVKLNQQANNIHLQALADTLAVEILANVFAMNRNNGELFPKYQLLPGFEDYSPEKLLFHSMVRQSCVSSPKSTLRYQMHHGPIPYHLRINGALRLSPIFSRTWECPRNAPMNPKEKCEFFEPFDAPPTDWKGKDPPMVEYSQLGAVNDSIQDYGDDYQL